MSQIFDLFHRKQLRAEFYRSARRRDPSLRETDEHPALAPAPGGPPPDVPMDNPMPQQPAEPAGGGEPLKQYSQMSMEAESFFEDMQDQLASLPPDSRDRATAEAALGLVSQYRLDSDDTTSEGNVKDSALMLADKLEELFDAHAEDTDGDEPAVSNLKKMREYAEALSDKLRNFRTNVAPPAAGTPPPVPPGSPQQPPQGGGEQPKEDNSVVGRERMMRNELQK